MLVAILHVVSFVGLRENNFFVAQISMDLYFDRINIIFSETLTIIYVISVIFGLNFA